MTILGWPQTQFQKKNHLAFIEGHHTSWFPTDQRSFVMDAARCRPPRSYPETGLRKVSGHVYRASCRNPEVVRSRHHGISNEKSACGTQWLSVAVSRFHIPLIEVLDSTDSILSSTAAIAEAPLRWCSETARREHSTVPKLRLLLASVPKQHRSECRQTR
jgi:hypothetical protein